MTTHELLTLASAQPGLLAALFAAPAGGALALQLTPTLHHPRGPLAVAWSTLIYAASVPGICAITAILYMMLFQRADLMKLDVLATFGPIAGMIATLGLAGRKVHIGGLPGIDRLGGMLMMLGATFLMIFFLDRTRILVMFHGSIWTLLGIGVVLFIVFKFGMSRVFGSRSAPSRPQY